MRVLQYNSYEQLKNCLADAVVLMDEHEIGVIDNALFEVFETDKYKDNKDFQEIYTAFHLMRTFVNHGKIGCDEVYMAHKAYDKLGHYDCWKELERKQSEQQ